MKEQIEKITRNCFEDFVLGISDIMTSFIEGIYYSFNEETQNDNLLDAIWDYCATDDFFKMCKEVSSEEFQKRTTK